MHGSNRLGGNSLSDLLVFGRRAGQSAAQHVDEVSAAGRPQVSQADVDAAVAEALEPLERSGGENPYEVHAALQQLMTDQVGLIRTEDKLKSALTGLEKLRARASQVSVQGGRAYNPGWHLAQDLRNMLLVSDCIAQSALERQESRGGHTRSDYRRCRRSGARSTWSARCTAGRQAWPASRASRCGRTCSACSRSVS